MMLFNKTPNGLNKVRAKLTDVNISRFFDVTIPKQLAAGKNEIKIRLINADAFAKGSDLLFDIIDSAGASVYYYVSPVANSDDSRSVIIQVDENTASGRAKFFMYTRLKTGGDYLYTLELDINSQIENSQEIKFEKIPSVVYSERRVAIQKTSDVSRWVNKYSTPKSVINTSTGIIPRQQYTDGKRNVERSEIEKQGFVGKVNGNIGTGSFQVLPSYISPAIITTENFDFSASMVGGLITVNGLPGNSFSASIVNVVSSTVAEIWPPYSDIVDGVANTTFFNHSNFTCSFNNTVEVDQASLQQTYAVFELYDISTGVGVVDSIDVNYKVLNQLGVDYQALGNYKIYDSNLLVSPVGLIFKNQTGISEFDIGTFRSSADLSSFWDYRNIVISGSSEVSNGVKFSSNVGFITPKPEYSVFVKEGGLFSLTLDYYNNNRQQADIFISGAKVSPVQVQREIDILPTGSFGEYIGSITEKTGRAEFTFKANNDGYIRPSFLFNSGSWSVGSIELRCLKKLGHNPTQARIIAPLSLPSGSEVSFKIDYLNPTGKRLSTVSSLIVGVFFRGNELTIPSGSSVIPAGTVSSSNQLTSSYDNRYTRLGTGVVSSSNQIASDVSGSFTAASASFSVRISTLESGGGFINTSSFATTGSNIFKASQIITGSLQVSQNITAQSFTGSFSGSIALPPNTVSGSDQLTSSYDARYERKGTNVFSSSAQVIYSSVTGIPTGLVTGSNQLTSSYDTRYEIRGNNIVSSSAQVKAFLPLGSVSGSDQATSSYDTRYERKGTNIFSSSAQVIFSGITGLPSTLVSGSNQLTSSYDVRYEVRGNNIVSSSVQVKAFLPANTISGSDQSTSSYDTRYERKGTNIFSSSAQVISAFPAGVISGSNQLTSSYDIRYELRGLNIISSSGQFTSFSSPFTGSFTGSFKGDFKGDGSGLYNIPLVSGSVPAGTVTGSDQLTSSYDTRYERKGTNIFSSSAQVIYGSITGIPSGLVTGSNQLTSSYDTRYELRGNNIVSSSAQVRAFLPANSVSGSDQLTASYDVRYERKGTNIFSSSAQVIYSSVAGIPTNLVSGSNQLTSSYDTRYELRGNNIVSSSVQVKAFLPAASVSGSDQLTSSYDTRYERKGTNIFSSSAQVVYSSITGTPANLVSGSNQLTSSYDVRYEVRGNNIVSSSVQVKAFLPANTISGSDQATSSYDIRYERKGTNIFSSSAQVVYSGIAGIPTNLVSGSNQLTSSYDTRYEIRGSNIVSSSAQVISAFPTGVVSGSNQLTSSYDTRYEIRGSNIISSSGQFTSLLSPFTGSFTGSFRGSFVGDGSGLYNIPLVSGSVPAGTVTGSDQLTSSYDVRYERKGTDIVSSSAQVKNLLPANTVSSSLQFSNLSSPFTGSFTGSFNGLFTGDGSGLYNIPLVSGSVPFGTVTGSDQLTSSYDTRYERKGTNIFSSSVQVIYSSITGIPVGLITGSNQLTSSYDVRYEIRGNNIVSSSAQVKPFLPVGSISGSDQLTSSYDTKYEVRGNNIVSSSVQVKAFLPLGSVSGSDQLTSSYDVRFERKGTNIFSSSAQVLSVLPAGTVTGSNQLTSSYDTRYEIRGNNIISSSAQIKSLLPAASVSGSDQLTSSYDTRYETRGSSIVSSSAQVKNFLPANTVSSSAQFTNTSSPFTGSFTGSFAGDGSGLTNLPITPGTVPPGTVSSSLQFNSTTLPFTGSFNGNFEGSGSGLTNIPGTAITPGYFALLTSNIFSGSQEIQGSGSKIFSVQGSVGELFAVFDGLSGSLFAVKNISGLPIFEVFSDNQVKIGQYGSEPIKISGSQAIITGSFKGDGSGLVNLPVSPVPANIISGSDQLTSSFDTRYERKGTNIFSSSAQVIYGSISGIPASLVSGSNQLTSSYDIRYERKGTNVFSASAQVNYNEILNKPIISLPQADRLINSDGTVSGSRANDGLQYASASSWTKLLLRTNVIQEQSYSSSFWTSQWTFVSQSTFVATPTNRNFSVYIPAGFNNDTNTPISSSTFHNSYAIEVENHIYGITGSKSAPINSYNWNSTTQFRAFYNPANLTLSPLVSSYVAQSSSIYQGMGGYGNAYAGRPDLNSWYSVTGVSYAGDGLFKVDLTLGPSSSFGWTLYIATTAKVIKHEIRV